MSLPSRFKSPGAVLQFLNSVDGQEIVKYFQGTLDNCIKVLRSENDLNKINYSQGCADTAEKITNLKKDIQQYAEDVRTGKIKPISTELKIGAIK